MDVRHSFIAAALLVSGALAAAQSPASLKPPSHEIFLASFKEGEPTTKRFAIVVIQSTGVDVGTPANITKNPADDDQPVFTPDSSGVWFASDRNGQRGIYRYDIAAASTARATPDDERAYEAAIRVTEPATPQPEDERGAVRAPSGSLVVGRASKLRLRKEDGEHWMQIADFKKHGVAEIARVAVSPDGKWVAIAAVMAGKK